MLPRRHRVELDDTGEEMEPARDQMVPARDQMVPARDQMGPASPPSPLSSTCTEHRSYRYSLFTGRYANSILVDCIAP